MARSTRMLSLGVFFAGMVLLGALGGCGVFTPEKGLLSNDDVAPGEQPPQGQFEANIVRHVECELSNGIWKAMQLPDAKVRLAWLKNYGAFVTLKLAVEDQSTLNPSASFLTAFGIKGAESFTLGLSGTGSANATRTETIQFTFPDGYLFNEANGSDCSTFQKGVLIDSDLKIGQFIYDKAFVAWTLVNPKQVAKSAPFSQIQFEINFVASFGGNVTPTWKFTKTSVNSSGTLFGATRTDTDYILMTLGPLNGNTAALHNAALTGNSAGMANQSSAR